VLQVAEPFKANIPLSLYLSSAPIHFSGSCTTQYLSDDTSPVYTSYSNLHLHLEQQRILARNHLRSNPTFLPQLSQSQQVINPTSPPPKICSSTETEKVQESETAYRPEGQGPRIMVVGPEDSGKSTLIKFLANYALRSPAVCEPKNKESRKVAGKEDEDQDSHTGWWPVIVNLDPREVSVCHIPSNLPNFSRDLLIPFLFSTLLRGALLCLALSLRFHSRRYLFPHCLPRIH